MLKGKKSLAGKSAVITGSTAGIGEAIARVFASEGARVAVTGRREVKGRQVVDEIVKKGGDAFYVKADVSIEPDIKKLVAQALEQCGKIDILVNNAAIGLNKPFHEATMEDWDRVMNTNLRSYFLASKYVLPLMLERKQGSILNIGSVAAAKAAPGTALYSIAKGGVHRMTKSMAIEYSRLGIRVNELCPGLVATEIYEEPEAAALVEQLVKTTPVERIGTPEEIAYAALYLVSDEAAFTYGASFFVDGGFTV